MSEEKEERREETPRTRGRRRRKTQNNPQGMFKLHEDKSHMASLPRSSCNPFSP
jgi:hypothetical protein